MTVTYAEAGKGIEWETTGLGHTLRYQQRIEPAPEGSQVRFTAQVEGPAGDVLSQLAKPLSALGQRRRLARLAALAEYETQRSGAQAVSNRSSR